MSTRPPVDDWATDFDHLDPRWIENPYPIWDELREKCPVAHTERFRGVYFPSRYEDVRAVAYDTENFSSRRIIVRETPPPRIPAPPITSDPPEHRPAKNLLLPAFTPDAIKRYEQHTRDICGKLVARFAGKSGCDAAVDYAQEIPVRVIAVMLGLPEEGGRPLPPMDSRNPRARHHPAGHPDEGDRRDHEVFSRRGREAPRRAARRSGQPVDGSEDRRPADHRGSSSRRDCG